MYRIATYLSLLLVASTALAEDQVKRTNPVGLHDTPYYSHVVTAPNGRYAWIAGQISFDSHGKLLHENDKSAQIRRSFENLALAIAAAGGRPEQVVKINVYSVDHTEADLGPIGEETTKLFGKKLPASTLVPVPRLARDGLLFEVDAELFVP